MPYHARSKREGISVYTVDEDAAAWSRIQLLATEANPSYLGLHPTLNVLYSVHGDGEIVSAYEIAASDGRLSLLGKQTTERRESRPSLRRSVI
jgi:6-phosphogluconolactonase